MPAEQSWWAYLLFAAGGTGILGFIAGVMSRIWLDRAQRRDVARAAVVARLRSQLIEIRERGAVREELLGAVDLDALLGCISSRRFARVQRALSAHQRYHKQLLGNRPGTAWDDPAYTDPAIIKVAINHVLRAIPHP